MDMTTTKKPDEIKTPNEMTLDEDNEAVCTKPFAAESARNEDEDGPCRDGTG